MLATRPAKTAWRYQTSDVGRKLAGTLPARLLLVAWGLGAWTTMGCGTTHVFADDPTARIWANGQLVGRGHGQLTRTGLPETTSIKVESDDGRTQLTSVSRGVTALTMVGALFTYGTCLIFCWQYPETVWAALPPRAQGSPSPGTAAARDPWLDPDPGWQAPGPTPPAAAPGIVPPQ